MKILLQWALAPVLALAAPAAMAEFHTFQTEEVFSNASGTVQFAVMHEAQGMDSENFWMGNEFTSTHLGVTKTYIFKTNLPGAMCGYYGCMGGGTARARVLIATQGFADLHLITPDFVVPNGFFPVDGGTINYADVDFFMYTALPTDGVKALMRDGTMVPNVATNFAGQSVSVTAASIELNQHGLTGSWFKQATSGQGVEVEVFANPTSGTGSTFVSWFTYDSAIGGADHQRWYTAQGAVMTGQPSAALTIYQNTGGNFNGPPVTTAQPVGTATLSFDTCSSGQLAYTFTDGSGRMGNIPLTRLTQNVTCSTTTPYPTNADFGFSGNWYNSATSGQGFTAEVNPNSGQLFSAWYTYLPNGAGVGAAGQRWYTAQGKFTPGQRTIPATFHETTGGLFDAPTAPLPQTVDVGFGTMAFQSCSAATFSYYFTGGSSSGLSGTIPLSRVGPVPPDCAPPPVTYQFTTIDFPGEADTQLYGIADKSDGVEIVGIFDNNTPIAVPFRFNLTGGASAFTSLPLLPGTIGSNTIGVNAAGTIVGGAVDATGNENAFILDTSGNFTVFSNPGWPNTEARGISSTGLVTGYSYAPDFANATSSVAFVYDPKQKMFMQILPGVGFDTVAQGINAAGQIVGNVFIAGMRQNGWLRAPNGDVTIFKVNGLPTIARGISDSGQIVGFVYYDSGIHKGFITTLVAGPGFEGVSIPDAELLEYPGAFATYLEGITNTGEITGFWTPDSTGNNGHGFIATPLSK
jgi:hypothetical protein